MGAFYVSLDGPVQYALESTTLLTSEKFKEDPTTEFIRIHYKYGNASFNCLQPMATNIILTKLLAYFNLPVCTSCLYEKATKLPHKTKIAIPTNEYKLVASVGDCVSVNVLVSGTPGLIEQMSEFIKRQRYQYACMFVDHNYDFTYIHLLNYQTGDE